MTVKPPEQCLELAEYWEQRAREASAGGAAHEQPKGQLTVQSMLTRARAYRLEATTGEPHCKCHAQVRHHCPYWEWA